ncbi:MAG: hypothetical protein ACRC7N_03065 [Clostridium sp.]
MLALLGVKITVIGVLFELLGFEKYVKNIIVKKAEKNEVPIETGLTKEQKIKKYLIGAVKEAWIYYICICTCN